MVEFTTNQWIVLGLVLVLGWLLGLASRSGGGRWKRAYHEERDAHAAYRAETEARIKASNERIGELDPHAPFISAGTAAAIGAAARGQRDDLSQIRGVDRDLELRLNESGIHSFRDVARLSRSDQATLEGRLGLEPGRIDREAWSDQAALLARGRVDEHHAAFG
jgi:predicted flap endonuclease-1-like 5' DNA nuclease